MTHANVVVASVLQHQQPQVLELSNGIVGRVDRLHALLAFDAHANVRLLDHGHVVGAIANGQRARLGHPSLDQVYHEALLVG